MSQLNQLNPIQMKIAELEQSILQAHPTLPLLLKEIHTILKNDPAVVTILTEDDIAVIVSGLKQQTRTEITAASLKSKKSSLKNTTLADL